MRSRFVFLLGLLLCSSAAAELQSWEVPATLEYLVCEGAIEPGCERFADEQFDAALNIFRPLAERGDPGAQNNLGVLFETGSAVPESKGNAIQWYRRAAAENLALAQTNLAILIAADHILGTADPSRRTQDFVEAYVLFSSATSQGLDLAADGLRDLIQYMTEEEIAEAKSRIQLETGQ